jgi:hypothetical protein
VLVCSYGANLPCGKANSDRDLPGAEAWCRDHANADLVPRFAIPWGNIYNWGCADGTPKSSRKSRTLIPAVLLPATGSPRIEGSLSDTMRIAPGTPDGSRVRFSVRECIAAAFP